jgi:hypothetical protein
MSDYSSSQDAEDIMSEYRKNIRLDTKLSQHQDKIRDFGESYERAYQLWNPYYAEAYKDLSYYLGNQWSLEELSYLNNQRRASFTYNKIRRIINLVQGYQRKNRLATLVSAVENASDETATLLTDVMQHVMTESGGYNIISDAFKGALTTGMSFITPWVDYRDDPENGDIKFHLDEWNAVILDPFFTKKDLSDCSFVARRKFLSRTEIISLHPDRKDLIDMLPWGERDDKFTYMPYARQWGMQKLMNYTEYWRTKWTMKHVVVDKNSGETHEWKGTKERLEMLKMIDPDFADLELIYKPVRHVELAIIVEGELLEFIENPFGLDDYPFVPVMAIFEPSYDLYTWKIQSLVRVVRDPQSELNRRRSKMVDLIDAQLNSGWIAKTGAVTNNASLFKTGNGQVIFLKPEADMGDIQRIQAPDIPQSMFQLEAEFEKDIMEIAGVNSELFGMAENENVETAGILSKMRQSAGLVNLQDLFDNLRESQRLLGLKVLRLIQANYSAEKVQLITKKQPTTEFFSKSFLRYNVVVDETVLTDTQKQDQFVRLMALKQLGVPVSDYDIIQNSNLHDKKAILEGMQAQQEKLQEMERLRVQHEMMLAESRANSDNALAAERTNKIKLDAALSAERISRAEEDRTAGVLNLVKAVKELEGIDIEHLLKKVQILQALEGGQEQKEQKVKSQTASA